MARQRRRLRGTQAARGVRRIASSGFTQFGLLLRRALEGSHSGRAVVLRCGLLLLGLARGLRGLAAIFTLHGNLRRDQMGCLPA